MDNACGFVYLVGAGCGPADWITVQGYRLLQRCTALVYDDLIDRKLLEAVPKKAIQIYMGKRLGQHHASQEDISRTLIDLARQGHTVVRLKGGDPFVFGRGSEEALALQGANIPFEVVPGISSAIAIPGQAGIPVTHRGLSRSFRVITAHTTQGITEQLGRAASSQETLVVLMGLSALEEIAHILLTAGRSPGTPAAVVSGGCAPKPMTIRAPLGQITSAAKAAGVESPAVIVVGDTAVLDLTSPQSRPLEGVRVALTGTPAIQNRLRPLLQTLGARTTSLMTVRCQPVSVNFNWGLLSQGPNWLVLTSQNGVDAFFQALNRSEVDIRSLAHCSFAVIGPSTGSALHKHGIIPDLCPAVHTSLGLADALLKAVPPGQPVRLFRSSLGSPELYRTLSLRFPTEDVALYDLAAGEEDTIQLQAKLEKADYLIFSSASGVNFLLGHKLSLPESLTCVCIGPVTAAALSAHVRRSFLTAGEISSHGIVQTILKHRGLC